MSPKQHKLSLKLVMFILLLLILKFLLNPFTHLITTKYVAMERDLPVTHNVFQLGSLLVVLLFILGPHARLFMKRHPLF